MQQEVLANNLSQGVAPNHGNTSADRGNTFECGSSTPRVGGFPRTRGATRSKSSPPQVRTRVTAPTIHPTPRGEVCSDGPTRNMTEARGRARSRSRGRTQSRSRSKQEPDVNESSGSGYSSDGGDSSDHGHSGASGGGNIESSGSVTLESTPVRSDAVTERGNIEASGSVSPESTPVQSDGDSERSNIEASGSVSPQPTPVRSDDTRTVPVQHH